jgi:hypothetical protein
MSRLLIQPCGKTGMVTGNANFFVLLIYPLFPRDCIAWLNSTTPECSAGSRDGKKQVKQKKEYNENTQVILFLTDFEKNPVRNS